MIIEGHDIYSIKGVVIDQDSGMEDIVNVAWVDKVTGESIKFNWINYEII